MVPYQHVEKVQELNQHEENGDEEQRRRNDARPLELRDFVAVLDFVDPPRKCAAESVGVVGERVVGVESAENGCVLRLIIHRHL